MKRAKFAIALLTLALGAASAATHSLTFTSAQWAGDKQLKPGTYKIELLGDKAVFKMGKTVVEVPATVQANDKKYAVTSFESIDSKLTEIDLGGTTTKVILGSAASGAAASK